MFRERTYLPVVLSLTCPASLSPHTLYVSASHYFTCFRSPWPPVGLSNKRKVTDSTPHVCPRCHNGGPPLFPLFGGSDDRNTQRPSCALLPACGSPSSLSPSSHSKRIISGYAQPVTGMSQFRTGQSLCHICLSSSLIRRC